jgi:hypothetical protein
MDAAELLDSPTFFEVAAADALIPSLKAALAYSLAVRPSDNAGRCRCRRPTPFSTFSRRSC